jgi:hypothetical protein
MLADTAQSQRASTRRSKWFLDRVFDGLALDGLATVVTETNKERNENKTTTRVPGRAA